MLIGLYENCTAQQEIPTVAALPRNDMVFLRKAKPGAEWLTEA